jgi:hypothetical protein
MGKAKGDPAWVAASDQADAAASGLGRRVADAYRAAVTAGVADWERQTFDVARGPAAGVLEGARARLEASDVDLCEHAALSLAPGLGNARPLEALVWVAWHPRVIACGLCALALPSPSDDENRRCDACARVTASGEPMVISHHVIRANPDAAEPGAPLPPPLVCGFGLCRSCARRSGMRS